MYFHEVVIAEVYGNCSLEILNLFAEGVCEPRQPAAVHTQCVVLFFNVRRGNEIHVRHAANNGFFGSKRVRDE
jgi:hypothetical protein